MNTPSDSLPPLDLEYDLKEEQIKQFRNLGHVFLPSVANRDEVNAYRPIINNAAEKYNRETRNLEDRDTYGKAFLQIENLWEKDGDVKKFSLARRFAKIAAQLLGVEGVRIYHDQALFKEPGGGPTPWHQDQHYWPLDTNNTLTMWMPLVDIPLNVGSMTFADGSHKLGYIGDIPISDDSQRVIEEIIRDKGFDTTNYGAMKAGDVTFHYGWTLHGAPSNPTEEMRQVMTVIYFPDGTKVTEPANPSQIEDIKKWLPDSKTGDLADTHLNPLVYHSKQLQE